MNSFSVLAQSCGKETCGKMWKDDKSSTLCKCPPTTRQETTILILIPTEREAANKAILYSVKQTVLQEMNVVLSSPGATSENKSPVGAEDVDYMHNTS